MLRNGTTHHGLGPPIFIINFKNVPQTYLQVNLKGTFSQLWLILPFDSILYQIDKTNQTQGQENTVVDSRSLHKLP